MEEIIRVAGEYYVLATSSLADDRRRVVKHADTFAVFDRFGDVQPIGLGEQGLYHDGTRYLSCLKFQIEGERPLLLSSNVTRDNLLATSDLTNPDIFKDGVHIIARGALHMMRAKFLWEGVCYERFIISNFGQRTTSFSMTLEYEADFADIFEVRGESRERRGVRTTPVINSESVELPYAGLDGIERRTRIHFSAPPDKIDGERAAFRVSLDKGESMELYVTTGCSTKAPATQQQYRQAHISAQAAVSGLFTRECAIQTANEQFNELFSRSISDLSMMLTDMDGNLYPYAGIPWYSTPFGRDGIITAMMTLWLYPEISRGVLQFLAQNQAQEFNDEQDAEPGKILHEMRFGEMTNTGELPYGKYYGGVDSTPLFVVLAAMYLRRTGEFNFIFNLWPKIEKALAWIDQYADLDGDGFIEYKRRTDLGLTNQGWKDSSDSIFHEDGALAEAPIALCEAQAYVFMAKQQAALMAEELGMRQQAMDLYVQARSIKKRFEKTFWDDQLGGYVLALDKDKRPCRIRASNMGHCLFAGIASRKRARLITDLLMSTTFNSGWGIRTVATGQPRYNPMSYHNGSIWPHDNAMIAYGMGRYGFKEEATKVLAMLFSMSQNVELHRLPELFCGFEHRTGDGPTLYPVACSPQAWASAAPIFLLKACLGLSVHASKKRVIVERPALPKFLETVRVRNLKVGDASMDLLFQRHGADVSVHIARRVGEVGLTMHK